MPGQWIEQRRRYRRYKKRARRLPVTHSAAIKALERYLLVLGPGRTEAVLTMLEDLADLFEQSAAHGTPVRGVVGDDPVDFAEAFLRNYPEGQWISRERQRLTAAIDGVAG